MQDSLPLQKASADAALENARAVVNAERAWIFIEEAESKRQSIPRKAHVQILGRNKRRTPAEVTIIACDFTFRPRDKKFPDEPWYPHVEETYRRYVASGETFEVYDLDCSGVTDEVWEDSKGRRLTFTGHVVYRDVITGGEHETRFCYLLSPNPFVGLIQCGPRNYNQHT
jgi:hypothetical protein